MSRLYNIECVHIYSVLRSRVIVKYKKKYIGVVLLHRISVEVLESILVCINYNLLYIF